MQPEQPTQQPLAAQAQQPSLYPFFPISDEGLKRLYQEAGRVLHQSIEQGVGQEKVAEAYQQLQVQVQQLQVQVQQLQAEQAATAEQEAPANEGSNGHQPVEMIPVARKKGAG